MPTLDWLNRDAVFRQLDQVPYRLLELVSEHRPSDASQQIDENGDLIGARASKVDKSKNTKNTLQAALNLDESQEVDGKNDSIASAGEPAEPVAPTYDNLLIQGDSLEGQQKVAVGLVSEDDLAPLALLPTFNSQLATKC
jgi:hypothetical protein